MNPIIETKLLTREFKQTTAVDSLNLIINTGDLFGLVGPDGAGKTTTLRLLAGLLDITSGSATISGHDLMKETEEIKPIIGYMAQRFSLYGELTVLENLNFFADLFDINPHTFREKKDYLLEFAGLKEYTNRRASYLSGGMQKKLALACTLIHQPPILLLDEPTTGVDPISRREFWNILNNLHLSGTTIIICTPYMDEADRCTKVGLMYAGSLIECASPTEIRGKISSEVIEIIPSDWQKARDVALNIEGVHEIQTYGESLHILVDSSEKRLPEIQNILLKEGISLINARPVPCRMEEAFISLITQVEAKEKNINKSQKSTLI